MLLHENYVETTRCADALAKKITRKGMTVARMATSSRVSVYFESKRICYVLFIECINSPSNCSPCSQMRRGVSTVVSLIFDSSLRDTPLFEMSRSVVRDQSCCACFLPSLHKTFVTPYDRKIMCSVRDGARLLSSRLKLLV